MDKCTHRTADNTVTAMREKVLGVASGTDICGGDMLGLYAEIKQYPLVRRGEVKHIFLAPRGEEGIGIRNRARKPVIELRTDLITALPYTGSNRDEDILASRALRFHQGYRIFRYTADGTAPACVNRSDNARFGVGEQYGYAVGSADGEKKPRLGRHESVDSLGIALSGQPPASVRLGHELDARGVGLIASADVRGGQPEKRRRYTVIIENIFLGILYFSCADGKVQALERALAHSAEACEKRVPDSMLGEQSALIKGDFSVAKNKILLQIIHSKIITRGYYYPILYNNKFFRYWQ